MRRLNQRNDVTLTAAVVGSVFGKSLTYMSCAGFLKFAYETLINLVSNLTEYF